MLRARDAMDRDYAKPLDIPTLAYIAHVSEGHFIRTFRATFGETPHRYLQRRRVERSMFFLRETDRTVTEVCFAVGFTSLGTFSRTFRGIVGETPSAVTLCRSTNDHTRSGPGKSGAPSYNVMVAPSRSVPNTSHGPIIQPISVIQKRVSSGCRSSPIHMSCADLIGNPQCVWTVPFGFPVVPDV